MVAKKKVVRKIAKIGKIKVEVLPVGSGGSSVFYNNVPVVEGLHASGTLAVLAGLLSERPHEVQMSMSEVTVSHECWYNLGRGAAGALSSDKAVSPAMPRPKKAAELELVELGGPGTETMCPLRHPGASVRILRNTQDRLPIMHWYQCPQGHGHKDWPATVQAAKRLAGMISQPHVKANRNLQVLDSE